MGIGRIYVFGRRPYSRIACYRYYSFTFRHHQKANGCLTNCLSIKNPENFPGFFYAYQPAEQKLSLFFYYL